MIHWLTAFSLTQALEIPFYSWHLRRQVPLLHHRLSYAFLASALTHPVVWFVFPKIHWFSSYWGMVLAAEAFAVIVEGTYLRYLRVKRPFLIALLVNAWSISVGLLLRSLTGAF